MTKSVPRPFHRGLDRAAVLRAALRVLDNEGPVALTMRRVARELDVEAASLYSHVRNKDDLVDGVLDVVLDEVRLPPRSRSARTWLIAGFSAYRATLVMHPAVVSIMTRRTRMSQSQFRLVERAIGTLESIGLSIDDAVLTQVAMVAFTLGFVLQEVGRRSALPPELLESSDVMQRAISALLRHGVDKRFRRGLETILDGALRDNGSGERAGTLGNAKVRRRRTPS